MSEEDSFLCPICGEDLTGEEALWRQVHINKCLAKGGKEKEKESQEETCPVCHQSLSRFSTKIAQAHINRCLDKQQKKIANRRNDERCPFCGASLKDLTPRELKIHEQTCRQINKAMEANVIRFPKVVEVLPTPEEWEIIDREKPIFIEPKTRGNKITNYVGDVFNTSDLQHINNESFSLKDFMDSFESA
jgi:hypothetical protein